MTRLLTVNEVAAQLGVKPGFVRDKAAKGELKAVRLSSQVLRFRESDVEALIAAHIT